MYKQEKKKEALKDKLIMDIEIKLVFYIKSNI